MIARALRQRLARQGQALRGEAQKALTSGAMPQRGGVNEGWPGWVRGSDPNRARGLRSDGKHLDPSGSAPLRGGAKEEGLGRSVTSGGCLQPCCNGETATQVLEHFRGGELTCKREALRSGWLDPLDAITVERRFCMRKQAEGSCGLLVIDPGNRSKMANAWRCCVRHRRGGDVGPECACSRAEADARECARASLNCRSRTGAVLTREACSARIPKGPLGA